MRDILTVAKKELRSCFRDKVILMQMLLLPFAMVFGYAMLMSAMMKADSEPVDQEINAYSINAPADFEAVLSEIDITAAPNNDIEKYISEIKDKKLDLLVIFPEDFAIAGNGAEELSDIEIYYNSDKKSSMEIYSTATMMFTAMQPQIFTINASPDNEYNLFDESAVFSRFLGSIIPIIVFMAVFLVCMNLAANSIVGDKEKGFLNTLLVTPVKRSSLAIGKSITILIAAIIGSISAFIGMAVSLPEMASAMKLKGSVNYSAADYGVLFLGVITAVFVLAVILLIVSTLAKDIRQATNIAQVFMLVLMVPSVLGSTESFSASIAALGATNYMMPVWNSTQLLKDIIERNFTAQNVIITCVVNIVTVSIGIFIVGKLFENEKIVNG